MLTGASSSAFALESRTICGQAVTSDSDTGTFPTWMDGTAEIYDLLLGTKLGECGNAQQLHHQQGVPGLCHLAG
jgi:hypothetical protein